MIMNYAIITADKIGNIDFAQVEQDNRSTLRYSTSGDTFVKFFGDPPEFLQDEQILTHEEILEEIGKPEWRGNEGHLRYIKYRAKGSAGKRSKELYVQSLGRALAPGEQAELLYPIEVSSKTFGGSVLVFAGDGDLFTQEEREDFENVGNDDWIEWQAKYQPVAHR